MEDLPTWIPVVALSLSDRAGRWLMHRRPAHKQHGGLWEFPGGKVEPGETPRAALVREIREELGIELDPACLRPTAFADDGTAGPVILLYTAARPTGAAPAALEGGAIGWFTHADISQLDTPPLDRELARALSGTGHRGGPS